jgi:hypothetical protein
MKTFNVDKTDDTPEVILDKKNGIFEIRGRSLPEDSAGFYQPLLDWIKSYKMNPNTTTEFVFKMDYFNTASSKFIQDILSILNVIPGAKIVWYYQEGDEDMEDMGHEFSELGEIPFDFRTY